MIQTFLERMYALLLSVPTNLIILLIICLMFIMFAQYTVRQCFRIVIAYAQICLLLSFFGITVPDFITVFNMAKNLVLHMFDLYW